MSDSKVIHKKIKIAQDHPSLIGHFPGNPVVPGVVLLDHVRQCVEEWKHSTLDTAYLTSVKFLSPLLMNDVSTQSLTILLNEKKATLNKETTKIEFRCMKNDDLIMQGQWVLQADRFQ